ncbi:Putative Flavin-containing monooxygenase [Penicillium brasilianum]|uniref:Putative Flavin-containing monooxygenase n=1 Tax=Penicillium brasilianum TaxID=104259 RepID=A0A0F7U3F2_PENBI|nr:Putative Flavin-containing monooxygenase [Penicillium brasilianum]
MALPKPGWITLYLELVSHVFYRNDPTLTFVGAVGAGLTFKVFEWQSVAAARVLAARATLPSVEEQEAWETDRMAVKGDGPAFAVINPEFKTYFEELRQIAGEPQEGTPGRPLLPFNQKWVDDFNSGHERRKRCGDGKTVLPRSSYRDLFQHA